ncbi:hypothetical protein D3C87_161640 [compost metagenome]
MHLLTALLAFFISTSCWASLPKAGIYSLVTGTQGCPDNVEWTNECGGFTLNPTHQGVTLPTEKFCYMNSGTTSELISSTQKTLRKVIHQDGRVQKIENRVFSSARDSISIPSEDSIIPDQEQGFLWDHAKNKKGFSCLYRK